MKRVKDFLLKRVKDFLMKRVKYFFLSDEDLPPYLNPTNQRKVVFTGRYFPGGPGLHTGGPLVPERPGARLHPSLRRPHCPGACGEWTRLSDNHQEGRVHSIQMDLSCSSTCLYLMTNH